MARLLLQDIWKSFGKVQVLEGIDLAIEDGEFIVLLGPSGCGKSTLLRIIAGLEDQSRGHVVIGEEVVDNRPPARRGVAMVFQSYALYPHLTVAGNWALGLRQAGTPRRVIEERIREAARILALEELLHRRPAELSGGQRQRVAIGRAIVREPAVMLFDEPLSNLDAALRSQVRFEIARLHRQLGATMVYVTHDQIEAMTLADRIVVLHEGVIQQVGSPADLYRRPCNLFVAGFIGSPRMNLLRGTVREGGLDFGAAGRIALDIPPASEKRILGVRPDGFEAGPVEKGDLRGTVVLNEYLGRQSYLHVELPQQDAAVIVEVAPDNAFRIGEPVGLRLRPGAGHLFDAANGVRIAD